MPRLARLDAPGVVHHIILKGIERRKIFRDNKDREDFLNRLAKLLPETQVFCNAWALIPNHAHFLLRTGKVPLATLMRRLLTGYVIYFNRRHSRCGQLFQNRYKSIVCQEDLYLRELVRYIHLNPVRAGIVHNLAELNRYPYCGHSTLMGKEKRDWQDVDYVLNNFGETVHKARGAYYSFLEAGVNQGHRDELTGGGLVRSLGGWSEVKKSRLKGLVHTKSDERILGESDFVDSVLAQADEKFERCYELKRQGYSLTTIAEKAAIIWEINVEDIFAKGKQKKKVRARSLLCYWAACELGISLTELARQLSLSVPGVGYAVEKGRLIAQKHNYQL